MIGLFGGFIGEMIIFLSALLEMGYDNSHPNFKSLSASPELVEEAITLSLQAISAFPDAFIEFPLSAAAEPLLEIEEPGLTIAGLNGSTLSSANL